MSKLEDLQPNASILGVLPSGLVTVVSVQWHGSEALELTYKTPEGKVANELLYRHDEPRIEVVELGRPWSFDGDGGLFRLVSEAQRIRFAHLFDPVLAVHTSMVEPLPHQITAVYESMLPRQPLRFLLADDPGAGKTIMAGLLIKELIARGDLQRCLIVCPGSLAEQWQDELYGRFHLPFEILTNDKLEAARTGNWFLETNLVIARLDKLSRNEDKDHCAGRCKPTTMAAHEWLLKKYINPKLGHRKLLDLRPADMAKLHSDLQATPYNANRVLGMLRAMLNCAERWEMIPRGSNPAAVVQPYSERKRERYLSEDELKALLDALDIAEADGAEAEIAMGRYEAAAIRLLIFTGCRVSEIVTLKWADADLAKARITLKQHKTDQYGDKIIPLNEPALKILKTLPQKDGNPYVIVGRVEGEHLINIQKPWRRVRKAAGLNDVRLHDLRHSFASFAVGAGIPLALIGGLLGHRSVQTTARYAHLANGPLKQGTHVVGGLLTPKSSEAESSENKEDRSERPIAA